VLGPAAVLDPGAAAVRKMVRAVVTAETMKPMTKA
jgi:hypothetical protein